MLSGRGGIDAPGQGVTAAFLLAGAWAEDDFDSPHSPTDHDKQ